MGEQIAIQVNHVSKDFVLPHEKVSSIKSAFTSLLRPHSDAKDVQHALHDVTFEVRKGEFFGIVGRNGSGKSTLLKILANIYQPTEGSVSISGKLVPFIELGVGFNPELTGRENVYLNGAMLGFSEKEVDVMYDDIVSFAELERFMDQKLKNYSSGMQVRLAFSMATRSEADVLLVDEVLAVGDADFQSKCFDYFRELKRKKKTVVFVSHDMSSVREYCDRVALIDQSNLKYVGDAETAAKKYIQLFEPSEVPKEEGQQKWGKGGIEITSVQTSKSLYTEKDKEIDVTVTFEAVNGFAGSVVCGLTIKNDAGQPICGTNNKIINAPSPVVKEGVRTVLTWRIPNIFNEGKITIEPAVVKASNFEVCQWWDDAKTIRITNSEKTPYLVAPRISVHFRD